MPVKSPIPWIYLFFFTFYFGTGFHRVVKDGFELVTFLPQPPEIGLQACATKNLVFISNLIMLVNLFLWWFFPLGNQTQDMQASSPSLGYIS